MLNVQNYKVTPAKITFRAESTEPETKNNVELKPPFKSNYGLKTGIAYTGIASSFTLLANLANGLNIKNHIKRLEEKGKIEHSPKIQGDIESFRNMQRATKKLWITVPMCAAIMVGCGAFVDKLINKKHADLADEIQSKPGKEILEENDNADVSRKGNLYLKTNTGKKVGTVLGAVVAPILSITSLKIAKFKIHPIIAISGVVQGALGGLLLGAITDHCSNKAAEKYADKQITEEK